MEENYTASEVPPLSPERGGIVTARGTNEGLVIRLDARVEEASLKEALGTFLASRRGFLEGNQVSLEWVGQKPSDLFVADVSELLSNEYGVLVKSSRLREERQRAAPEGIVGTADKPAALEKPAAAVEKTPNLFGGMEALTLEEEETFSRPVIAEKSEYGAETFLWDEADARLVYATLRSGQRIESEHSLVVFGDVNSGAEIISGGDIVVLGVLRGVAHAGAYDETGGGRFIFALNLLPTQLRIGSIISRGSAESRKCPEIARVEGTMIMVEPYHSRHAIIGRRG